MHIFALLYTLIFSGFGFCIQESAGIVKHANLCLHAKWHIYIIEVHYTSSTFISPIYQPNLGGDHLLLGGCFVQHALSKSPGTFPTAGRVKAHFYVHSVCIAVMAVLWAVHKSPISISICGIVCALHEPKSNWTGPKVHCTDK
jgi:hypothetical protein